MLGWEEREMAGGPVKTMGSGCLGGLFGAILGIVIGGFVGTVIATSCYGGNPVPHNKPTTSIVEDVIIMVSACVWLAGMLVGAGIGGTIGGIGGAVVGAALAARTAHAQREQDSALFEKTKLKGAPPEY
jgi:hypothetical protein